jgi:phenylacetate-CoA ligase
MPITAEITRAEAQAQRLGRILPHWLNKVPLYQPAAALMRHDGGNGFDLQNFSRLPLITKADIRRGFPRNFLAAGVELETLLDLEMVEVEQTSGTSEERTPLLLGLGWWAEQEERALRLNRFVGQLLDEFPEARRVTINSPVCSGDICYTGVPSRAERALGGNLFVNLSRHPFLWSPADLARMAEETVAWEPQFLDVDPVYGLLFALYCERQRIRLPSLQFILCSYEYVSQAHRRILERVFGVPVFNLYGSTETGHLLMEREIGAMLPSLETAFLEVINVDARGVGDLIVTTLTNQYMPLIRYQIGDLVERQQAADCAACQVHGRAADAFTLGSGRRVTTRQVDDCFDGIAGIAHYQLRQGNQDEWRLRFVPDAAPPSERELEELRQRLSERLEAAGPLELVETPTLLAENSGKFRLGYPKATSVG